MSRESNIQSLVDMGFSRELAAEAIKVNGYVEPAIQWCIKKQQSEIGYSLGGSGQPLGSGGGQKLGGNTTGGGDTTGSEQIEIPPDIPPEIPPEPKRVMTEEEKAAALEKIQQRIAEKKKEEEIESERSEVQREKQRRFEGKEAQAAKDQWEKAEAERNAAIKKAEKERDRIAREKVLENMRIDRLNREAEEKKRRGVVVEQQPEQPKEPVVKKDYNTCTIQIRMPDNSRLQSDFKPDDTIETVLTYVNANRKDGKGRPLVLSTSYPKVSFTGELVHTTLTDAGLVPRGMLIAN